MGCLLLQLHSCKPLASTVPNISLDPFLVILGFRHLHLHTRRCLCHQWSLHSRRNHLQQEVIVHRLDQMELWRLVLFHLLVISSSPLYLFSFVLSLRLHPCSNLRPRSLFQTSGSRGDQACEAVISTSLVLDFVDSQRLPRWLEGEQSEAPIWNIVWTPWRFAPTTKHYTPEVSFPAQLRFYLFFRE